MVRLTSPSLIALLVLLSPSLAAPGTTDCEVDSKQKGVCISTGSCQSSGGVSEANHCPGGVDIQCCTYGSCTVSGTKGLCQPTGGCEGTSTPGFCPGPTDIQCCTKEAAPAPVPTPKPAPSGGGGDCNKPTANDATLKLIQGFEGWYPNAYKDPDGNPTIGYGHLCSSSSCSEISYSIPLSKSDGDKLMQDDLLRFRQCIAKQVSDKVKLNANQFGALVSWAFNVGCGNTESSSLIQRLNDGDAPNTVASQELPKWNHGANGVLPGLTRRRGAEVDLFKTETSTPAC